MLFIFVPLYVNFIPQQLLCFPFPLYLSVYSPLMWSLKLTYLHISLVFMSLAFASLSRSPSLSPNQTDTTSIYEWLFIVLLVFWDALTLSQKYILISFFHIFAAFPIVSSSPIFSSFTIVSSFPIVSLYILHVQFPHFCFQMVSFCCL